MELFSSFIVPWLRFTQFHFVLVTSTRCHRFVLGFTGFYRILPSFHGFLPGFTGFYRVWLGLTGFYRVLLGFFRVSPGVTVSRWRIAEFCCVDGWPVADRPIHQKNKQTNRTQEKRRVKERRDERNEWRMPKEEQEKKKKREKRKREEDTKEEDAPIIFAPCKWGVRNGTTAGRFYRVVTGFYRVLSHFNVSLQQAWIGLNGLIPSLNVKKIKVLLWFTGVWSDLLFWRFTRFLPSFTGFYWVLKDLTWFYWVWLGFTRFDWVWLGLTEFYWVYWV